MKNIILKFALVVSLIVPMKSFALDSKVSAVILMAGYGTVGGALLGTASLAFGAGGRSVAKGASIGLYSGLIFGGYIVLSHQLRQNRLNNPEPEPETDETYDDEGAEGIFGSNPRKLIQDFRELHIQSEQVKLGFLSGENKRSSIPPLAFNILSIQF